MYVVLSIDLATLLPDASTGKATNQHILTTQLDFIFQNLPI